MIEIGSDGYNVLVIISQNTFLWLSARLLAG